MSISRSGSAVWQGDLKEGKGTVSTESGALREQPYGFNTRFENTPGTNPEELIGAAHASCFAMAFALQISEAGFIAESIDAKADVRLDKQEGGFAITAVALTVEAKVPEMSESTFLNLAEKTKTGCPVSKVLSTSITLNAILR